MDELTKEKVERKDRDEHGRFAKGNRVPAPKRGRPHRGDIMPVLVAITETYTPSQISAMMVETWNMAKDKEDWKGMYTILNLIVSYAIGKPVQRSLTATIDPEQIKALFSPEGGGEEGEDGEEEEDSTSIVDVIVVT